MCRKMTTIESLTKKALELKKSGLSEAEIGDELNLSINTITWIMTRNIKGKKSKMPADVKIGWRSIGVLGHRTAMTAGILADIVMEETMIEGDGFDTILGIAINGIPLACFMSEQLESELAIYKPPVKEGGKGTFSSNYASVEGKKVVLVDDVVSTGESLKHTIASVKDMGGDPILAVCLVNKTSENVVEGIPLRAMIRARAFQ